MTEADARPKAWPALLCAGVAVLLFLPTLRYGFVYDDQRFVQANTALSDPAVLWRAFTDAATQTSDGTHAGLWRPLRTLSFALDRMLFGTAAWGGHLTNVLLHGAGAALLARLLQALGASALAAALGGLLYAVHPVQVECVAWISSRGDVLAAALVWGALLAQLSGRLPLACALGVAALLSKEQAVVWPAFAFLVACARGDGASGALKRAAVPAAIVVAFVGVRAALLADPLQQGGLTAGTVGLPGAARMLAHQAWYALFPVGGVFDWQMPEEVGGIAPVALGAVALGALLLPCGGARACRRSGSWLRSDPRCSSSSGPRSTSASPTASFCSPCRRWRSRRRVS